MKDIFIKEDDLEIVNGDFVVAESDLQQQYLLLMTDKGEWKEHPRTGVGLSGFLEDENPDALYREIREQFMMDGLTVKEIKNNNGILSIDAK